jgi:hypothetical protein
LKFYATRIRTLKVYTTETRGLLDTTSSRVEVDATLLAALADHFPKRLILSSLRDLQFIGRTKFAFPLVQYFLAPTLERLEVDLPMTDDVDETSVTYFSAALASLSRCCPVLEELTINRWDWTDDCRWDARTGVINPAEETLASAVSDIILSIPRLRSLVCFTSLTPAAASHIRSMSALRTLACHIWPSTEFSMPGECQVIELTLCFVTARDAIRAVSSIVHFTLTTLHLRVGRNMGEDDMRLITEAVASNRALHSLAEFSFGFREDEPWGERDEYDPSVFRLPSLKPLLRLGRMTKLSIEPVILDFNERDAEDIGRSWPKLQYLRTRSLYNVGHLAFEPLEACLSLQGLAALVLQCPDLVELDSIIDLSGPIPDCTNLRKRGQVNTKMTTLYVGETSPYISHKVASFLISILPNLDGKHIVFCDIMYDESEEDMEESEERVAKLIRSYEAMQEAAGIQTV